MHLSPSIILKSTMLRRRKSQQGNFTTQPRTRNRKLHKLLGVAAVHSVVLVIMKLPLACDSFALSFLSSSSSATRNTMRRLHTIERRVALSSSGDAPRSSDHSDHSSVYAMKQQQLTQSTRLSLAPMMDYTTRHFRFMIRLITQKTLLYSEMVAANALAREQQNILSGVNEGKEEVFDDWQIRRVLAQSLASPQGEGPSVLQLGGSDPEQLYQASAAVFNAQKNYCNYTAMNLNCGCPSPKVAGKGCFGAALMHNPVLVRDLCTAMYEGAQGSLPVTVKCRIGTDSTPEDDLYSNLCRFTDTVASRGIVTDFQIHARIAILNKKLSPADNRKIPKLKYDLIHRLVKEFPELTFSLNGGIENIFHAREELDKCPKLAGVMVGRAMAAQPWHWAMADELLHGASKTHAASYTPLVANRWEVLEQFGVHADKEELIWGPKIRRFTLKALQGLFSGEPNARRFRTLIDTIGGIPKKHLLNGESVNGPPPSELILNAARDCFSDEVLFRTREESFEMARVVWEKSSAKDENLRSSAVQEWQQLRKEDELKNQEVEI